MDLDTEMTILACNTCYTQNGDWGTRKGLGDLLQIGLFMEIQNLQSEF
jgi:hypothetical protein